MKQASLHTTVSFTLIRHVSRVLLLFAVALSLILAFLTGFGRPARGEDTGETLEAWWDFALSINPGETGQLLGSKVEMDLSLSIEDTRLGLRSEFRDNWDDDDPTFQGGFYRQIINLETNPYGGDLESRSVFLPYERRLDYSLTKFGGDYRSLSVENNFLVEYVEADETYGAGWELILEGGTSEGLHLSIANRFGMDKYLREVHNPSVSGSGYYIITGKDNNLNPRAFPYGSTLVTVNGIELGCTQLSNRTKFTRNKGLLYSGFRYTAEADSWPLSLTSYLYFSVQSASLTVVPSLSLTGEGWEVSADLGGVLEWTDQSTPRGLRVNGFKIDFQAAPGLHLSGLTALAGKIWRDKGSKDIFNHMENYTVSEPVGEIARNHLYEETKYDEIVSIEVTRPGFREAGLSLILDTYFDRDQPQELFDISLVTGEVSYSPGEWLDLIFFLEGGEERGVKRIVAEVKYAI